MVNPPSTTERKHQGPMRTLSKRLNMFSIKKKGSPWQTRLQNVHNHMVANGEVSSRTSLQIRSSTDIMTTPENLMRIHTRNSAALT
ncbi:unnamed protein product [Ambrosiozyma monospora]|uniref:Unnamed protein product n=1 Tax=Ambrosiozyma monospora TaxID=43982 RepID=A0ACB5U3L2_AMBMO|nr:unnamed protein product [Ambrosiozyma monospora]